MTSALFRRPAHTLRGSLDVSLQIRKCKKPLKKAETLLKKYKLGCREEGVLPWRSDNAQPNLEHGDKANTARRWKEGRENTTPKHFVSRKRARAGPW